MPLKLDINLYALKVAETELTIAEKREQLAASSDPYEIATLQRSLTTLEDMVVIFRKTARALTALRKLDEKKESRSGTPGH